MEIKGNIKVFVNDITTDKGESFKTFRASLTRVIDKEKKEYDRIPVNVVFSGKSFSAEKLAKFESKYYYDIDVTAGFLSFVRHKDGKGYTIQYVITEAKVTKKTEVKQKVETPETDEDLPF